MPDTIMASVPDSAQDYVDSLKQQLADAKLALNTAAAAQNAAQQQYDKTVAWKKMVCDCLDSLEKTNLLADALITALQNANHQASVVGSQVGFAAQAFLHLIADLKKVMKQLEALKKDVPTGTKTAGNLVSDACQKLADSLAEAMTLAQTTMTALLEIYEWSQLLLKSESGDQGLSCSLEYTLAYFTSKEVKDSYTDKAECTTVGRPYFPLSKAKDPYFKSVSDDCSAAEASVTALLAALKTAQTDKNKAQTCYDALKAAYEAASKAKTW